MKLKFHRNQAMPQLKVTIIIIILHELYKMDISSHEILYKGNLPAIIREFYPMHWQYSLYSIYTYIITEAGNVNPSGRKRMRYRCHHNYAGHWTTGLKRYTDTIQQPFQSYFLYISSYIFSKYCSYIFCMHVDQISIKTHLHNYKISM